MKRWFRPVAYGIIAILVALAVFSKPKEEDDLLAPAALRSDAGELRVPRAARHDPVDPAFALRDRNRDRWATNLFLANRQVTVTQAPVTPAVAASIPEWKVLGWMMSDATPFVFVEFEGEGYSLTPSQTAGDVYRFDRIGGGFAEFTYLPDGKTRQFPVSDPDASE